MHLTHLSLSDFRNFTRLDLTIPSGAVLLIGDNAQGKTSLLEAIYYLATFTSFHASSERQLINFLAARQPLAVARIVADFEIGPAAHRLEVRLIQEANGLNGEVSVRKEVLLDGLKYKASQVVGQFNAVFFLPQILRVIEGAPEERRRYLNLALAQVAPGYAETLSAYTRAQSQRNALLKLLHERGGDLAQLDFWDGQLASTGAHLLHTRIRAIQELDHLAVRVHHELTRGGEVLRLNYQPAYDPLPRPQGQMSLPVAVAVDRTSFTQDQLRKGFQDSLLRARREDIERGVTTLGPHRDEIRFLSNGVDLGSYGSRGQVRTAMLAMKIAEFAWMKEKTGQCPVLLLDEVLAELDIRRRLDLLARLEQSEQVLLTTTDLDLFSPDFINRASVWQVKAGRITTAPGNAPAEVSS